jgi:hypothetical protein
VELAAFCLYYASKRLTMLDAAEDWNSFTPEERAPFMDEARELEAALGASDAQPA